MDQTLTTLPLIDLKGDLSKIQVLCVFGVGDGSSYRQLSSWLRKDENRFLVFVENDESLFLQAKELVKEGRSRLYFYKAGDEELLKKMAWEFVFLPISYAAHPDKGDEVREFFTQLDHYVLGTHLLASDCQDMGVKVLKNVFYHMKKFPEVLLGDSLEGKCRGIPAVVCGAGVSLNELDVGMREMALIIAGGTAVKALNAKGINPHIYANVDPEPPYERFLRQDTYEVPFFYQSRLSKECAKTVHGPLMWMPDSGSYPLEGWLSHACGLFTERFDSGWTVANFSVALAAHLGCNPIICIGMDFCCSSDEIYASSIKGEEHGSEWIEIGEKKLSKRDWLMSAEWMADFVAKHKEIEWINWSDGVPIAGMEKKNLDLAQFDVAGFVHALQAEPSGVSCDQVKEVMSTLRMSFEKCQLLCDQMMSLWEKHYKTSPLDLPEYALCEVDLEQQVCYRYLLAPLWNVWKHPILRAPTHPFGHHLHRLLFYKNVITTHLPQMDS